MSILLVNGEAEPRLTSGGGAATTTSLPGSVVQNRNDRQLSPPSIF